MLWWASSGGSDLEAGPSLTPSSLALEAGPSLAPSSLAPSVAAEFHTSGTTLSGLATAFSLLF